MRGHLEALHEFRIPLTSPLMVGVTERSGLFITLGDDGGARGIGEIAPLPGFHAESTEQCLAALAAERTLLNDLPLPREASTPPDLTALFTALAPFVELPSLHFGLTMACLNLLAARHGVLPAQLLDCEPQESVIVNGLVSSPPDQWLQDAQRLVGEGFSILKVKVGRTDSTIEATALLALRARLGEQVGFVLDGNRAWGFSEAEAFLAQIASLPLRYCEELLKDPCRLAELQARSGVAMALDETLFEQEHDADIVHDWPSVVVLKLDRIQGGLPAGLTLAAGARKRGQPAIVSSAFNTVPGWAFLVQVAAALHSPHAGLDTLRAYPAALACPPGCMHGDRINVAHSWINSIAPFAPYISELPDLCRAPAILNSAKDLKQPEYPRQAQDDKKSGLVKGTRPDLGSK